MDKASSLVSLEPGGERCLQLPVSGAYTSTYRTSPPVGHESLLSRLGRRAGRASQVSEPGGHRGEPWRVRKCFSELTVSGNDGHDEQTREEAAVTEEGQRQVPGLEVRLGQGCQERVPSLGRALRGPHSMGHSPSSTGGCRDRVRPATEAGPDGRNLPVETGNGILIASLSSAAPLTGPLLLAPVMSQKETGPLAVSLKQAGRTVRGG